MATEGERGRERSLQACKCVFVMNEIFDVSRVCRPFSKIRYISQEKSICKTEFSYLRGPPLVDGNVSGSRPRTYCPRDGGWFDVAHRNR